MRNFISAIHVCTKYKYQKIDNSLFVTRSFNNLRIKDDGGVRVRRTRECLEPPPPPPVPALRGAGAGADWRRSAKLLPGTTQHFS